MYYAVLFSILLLFLEQCSYALIPDDGEWEAPCFLAWEQNCKNFVQAAVVGPAYYFQGKSMHLLFNCMAQDTKEKCESYNHDDKDKACNWCQISSNYTKVFGDGACTSASLNQGNIACSLMESVTFIPILNAMEKYNITVPKGPGQAACLLYNKDKQTCEGEKHGGHECGYYELPRLYGWLPYSGICFEKNLMGDEHWGMRAALADLPESASDEWVNPFMNDTIPAPSHKTTTSTRGSATKSSTEAPFYTTKNGSRYIGTICAVLIVVGAFL